MNRHAGRFTDRDLLFWEDNRWSSGFSLSPPGTAYGVFSKRGRSAAVLGRSNAANRQGPSISNGLAVSSCCARDARSSGILKTQKADLQRFKLPNKRPQFMGRIRTNILVFSVGIPDISVLDISLGMEIIY